MAWHPAKRMRQLAWFVGLWALSVAVVAGAAYGLRALIGA
jgi:hypothetical protein